MSNSFFFIRLRLKLCMDKKSSSRFLPFFGIAKNYCLFYFKHYFYLKFSDRLTIKIIKNDKFAYKELRLCKNILRRNLELALFYHYNTFIDHFFIVFRFTSMTKTSQWQKWQKQPCLFYNWYKHKFHTSHLKKLLPHAYCQSYKNNHL